MNAARQHSEFSPFMGFDHGPYGNAIETRVGVVSNRPNAEAVDQALSVRLANMSMISAIMVVVIHVLKRPQEVGSYAWWLRQFTGEGVCRIAVPFFFMAFGFFLAGHLKDEGWYGREIGKRMRSLALPYIFWSVVGFVVCSLILGAENIMADRSFVSGVLAFKRFGVVFGINPFCRPELRTLWFIRALFVLLLVSPLINKLVKLRWPGLAFAFVLYLIGKPILGIVYPGRIYEMLNFFFSFEGLMFFMLGLYFRQYSQCWLCLSLRASIILLVLGTVVLCVKILCEYLGFLYFAKLGLAVSIFLLLLGMISIVPSNRILFHSRDYAFPLYLIHLNVNWVAD